MIRLSWIVLSMFLFCGCALIKGKEDVSYPSESSKPSKEFFSGYDNNTFVADVTIPDGMEVFPGEKFEKIWRIRNTGNTTWNDYKIIFIHGDLLDAPYEVSVPITPPGEEIDIKIIMKTPRIIGSYTGFWKMKNNKGAFFGDTFWIDIKAKD